jgi:hypothetical protein
MRSLESRERKRAYDRGRNRNGRKLPAWMDRFEGADEESIVLHCTKCWRFFDIPRSRMTNLKARVQEHCDDCLEDVRARREH